MNEPKPSPDAPPDNSPVPGPGPAADAGGGVAPNTLTPEEQMALYEKELKETDWGHQPC